MLLLVSALQGAAVARLLSSIFCRCVLAASKESL